MKINGREYFLEWHRRHFFIKFDFEFSFSNLKSKVNLVNLFFSQKKYYFGKDKITNGSEKLLVSFCERSSEYGKNI